MAKKRKAAATAASPASKKVRINNDQDVIETTPSGRARRSTSNDAPKYGLTNRRGSNKKPAAAAKSADTKSASTKVATATDNAAPKRRGRPRKVEQQEDEPQAEIEVEKNTEKAVVPMPRGILKNKNTITHIIPVVEESSSPKGKGGRSKKSTTNGVSAEVVVGKPTSKKAKKLEELDGLTDEEALTKSAGLAHEDIDPEVQYWLMKAEPESRIEKGVDVKFSIDDLAAKSEPEGWDGVRNPVARNNMRAMRVGDLAFFYHSNCKTPGVVGVMRIVEEHTVDESAFDPDHPYYDPKSDRAKPKWELVKVEFVKKFEDKIGLKELRSFAKEGGALEKMQMLKQSRLSVSSVSLDEWCFILEQAGEKLSLGQPAKSGGYEGDTDGEAEEDTVDGKALLSSFGGGAIGGQIEGADDQADDVEHDEVEHGEDGEDGAAAGLS